MNGLSGFMNNLTKTYQIISSKMFFAILFLLSIFYSTYIVAGNGCLGDKNEDRICAQATSLSSFASPVIEVQYRTCGIFGLGLFGCNDHTPVIVGASVDSHAMDRGWFSTYYAYARVLNLGDPGYTPGKHLDNNGKEIDDDSDNKDLPKLCAAYQTKEGSDKWLGCVELHFSPIPPYCDKYSSSRSKLSLQKICPNHGNGLENASNNNRCVLSSTRNNAIYNSVRIQFDEPIPLCQDQSVKNTLYCINHSADLKASQIYKSYGIIPKSKITNNIGNLIPLESQKNPFRAIYGIKSKNSSKILKYGYYNSNLKDCGDHNNDEQCITIWGINTGNYQDISIAFPAIDNNNSNGDSFRSNFRILNSNGEAEDYYGVVTKVGRIIGNYSQYPQQLCVYESQTNKVVGCVDRAQAPTPNIIKCTDSTIQNRCISTIWKPAMVVELKVDQDATQGVIGPIIKQCDGVIDKVACRSIPQKDINPLAPISEQGSNQGSLNLAGSIYTAFATNDNFLIQPFDGDHALDKDTRYGNYKDNIYPIDLNDPSQTNPKALYINGLQYIDQKYVTGATRLVLDLPFVPTCQNVHNCVLSQYANTMIIPCENYYKIMLKYNNPKKCSEADINCQNIYSYTNPQNNNHKMEIKQCQDKRCYTLTSDTNVCFQYNNDPQYRVIPKTTASILQKDEYYTPKFSDENTRDFDGNKYYMRNKTSIEEGLFVKIDQPKCEAITLDMAKNNDNNGYATCTEKTELGYQATCNCIKSYSRLDGKKDMSRYCVLNLANSKAEYEPLNKDDKRRCYPISLATCIAETNTNIDWPATKVGETAEGTCQEGFIKSQDSLELKRKCDAHKSAQSNLQGQWAPVSNAMHCIKASE